jgi:uncharacterized protein YoxC
MEIVLYSAGAVALVMITVFLIRAMRTLGEFDSLLRKTHETMEVARKDLDQMTGDITQIRTSLVPILTNMADVTQRLSVISEGLQARIDGIYDTIDDAVDVARGTIDDIERIKDNVVAAIDAPISAAREKAEGIVSTIVKGVGLVKDVIGTFKKNGKSA